MKPLAFESLSKLAEIPVNKKKKKSKLDSNAYALVSLHLTLLSQK